MAETWAATVRLGIIGRVNPKMMKNKKSKRFLACLEWTKKILETHLKVPLDVAKKQHKELIGPIKPKAWSSFSKRVKDRLNLRTLEEKNGRAKVYAWVPKT